MHAALAALTSRPVQALLQVLPSMHALTALTLQCRVSAQRVSPLLRAVAALRCLGHLSLLLHPPRSSTAASSFSEAVAHAWPVLTALSALLSLSLPVSKLTNAVDVYRATHRHLTAFSGLQTLSLPFATLTQPEVWVHVAQLSTLSALRISGFTGPEGSMPDIWLQAVATATCACVHLRHLVAEDVVDEVLPWLGAHLSRLGGLEDLRVTSSRPGSQMSFGALTHALASLPHLTHLHLGTKDCGSGGAVRAHGGSFATVQRQRAQSVALLAALAPLTRLRSLRLCGVLSAAAGVEESHVLAASLRQLRRLTRLDLSGNVISLGALRTLAPVLAVVGGLLRLELRDCGIEDDGMRALARAVSALRELRRLDVRGSSLGVTGVACLVAAAAELPLEDGVLL